MEKEVVDVGSAVTRYVYDNEDILLELDGNNAIRAHYTHGPGIDEPLIMERGGQSFFYHADGLGSITDITNQSGTVVQQYAYSSFGKIESQSDPTFIQPYTFTSREWDEDVGLYYYRARCFDGPAGRFLQEDPVSIIPSGFTQRNHLYVYVVNKPVIGVDPSGAIVIAPQAFAAIVGGVIGAVNAAAGTVASNPDANFSEILSSAGTGAMLGAVGGFTLGSGILAGGVKGFVSGAISDVIGQALGNYAVGEALFDIRWGEVIHSAVGGAISGAGVPLLLGLGATPAQAIGLAGGMAALPELMGRAHDRDRRRDMIPYQEYLQRLRNNGQYCRLN